MSEPAKSANEIEDVLSSIRRLVSEGQGSAAPSKLVLTAAQRVVEPDDPWAPVPDAVAAAEPGREDDPAWGLEDRLSDWGEIEDSAQDAVDEAMAEHSVAVPPGPADAVGAVAGLAGEAAETGEDQPGFEAETGDTNWPDAGATRALRDLALVRGHSAPGAEDQAEAPEQDGGVETAVEDEAEGSASGEAADPVQEGDTSHAMAEGENLAEEIAGDATAPDDSAPDVVQAVEGEAEAEPVADAEPSPRIFSRRAEQPRDAEPVPEAAADSAIAEGDDLDVEDLGDDPQPFSFPETEDGILDEETLRQIVADVVRAELQGVLGQRITRNVRKMVRREVRLALAAQELE